MYFPVSLNWAEIYTWKQDGLGVHQEVIIL